MKRSLPKAVHLGMVQIENATTLEKFRLLRDLGFDGVEVNRPDEISVAELLRARDATGVKVANVVDAAHWKKPLSHPDRQVRAEGLAALEAALRDARELGCSTALLVPAVVNQEVAYADAYERSQTEIRKALPLAEQLGVKIGIENVWNHFLLSPLEAARYLDELGAAAGWNFDAGNIVNFGWPEQWIRVLGGRIVNFHVKEFSRKKRDAEGLWKGFDVELLEGDCHWPAVMAALDETGYCGWMIAEVRGGNETRLRDIAERMDRIAAS